MAITPSAGYTVDPNNPNAVIPSGSSAQAQNLGTYNTGATPSANISYGNVNQPAATAPTTPAPQPTTTPTVTINNTTSGSTQPASQPTSTTTGAPNQGALQMPANGSVVDLLNMAGQDSSFQSRQQLAQQYGIQGYTGSAAQNTDLAKKYLDAFNANKGTPTPQTSPDARSALGSYFDNNPAQTDPQKTAMDGYFAMNPIEKTLYDQINQLLSTPNTTTSFKDEYAKLQTETGLPALNTELMNIKNIMDGTEDDIRAEVEKSGGFATESQVQALVGARNKTLIKQANNLQQQIALKNDYVDHLMQFSEMDRAEVEKQVDRKLGLTEKLAAIQEKITGAAKDNYEKIIENIGYKGFADLFKDNPTGMKQAEQILGLPAGTLKNEALMATQHQGDYQFVPGTENQQSGVFDKTTGTFTPNKVSGGTTSGGTSTVDPAKQAALSVILGSANFTKQQKADLVNAVNNGADPFTVLKNQAKNIMGQTLATSLSNNEKARDSLEDLDTQLKKFYALGGSTNLFSGNMETAINKLGTVSDPKLVELATQIQSTLQIYRNAVSGTAYSVQEGKDIASIFPGINKTEGLNQSIINGRMMSFDSVIDSAYKGVLGDVYEQFKASSAPTPSEIVEQAVNDSGMSYDAIIKGAPNGQIAVIDKKSGEIGYIPAEEFNTSYIRM